MDIPRWEHFEHDADMGVRGIGDSLETAFEQAACALTAVITDPSHVRDAQPLAIRCTGECADYLLYAWLNELIYRMATEHLLFSRFEVHIRDKVLNATVWGEPLDRVRHRPAVEVKGATFTALRVARDTDGNWIAQTVVDV